jgi:hypothetical protein
VPFDIFIGTTLSPNMEATREESSTLSIAAEQPPPLSTYTKYLRTIVKENPEFRSTLSRLEGGLDHTVKSAHVRAFINDFGTSNILDRYFWDTNQVCNIVERPSTPGTKTRIIYIAYDVEVVGDSELILPLIDGLGIHFDLEPSFVDAVLFKLSGGFSTRERQKRYLDLHLDGDKRGSMDATICIKNPSSRETAETQHSKLGVDRFLQSLAKVCLDTILIFFNEYPTIWGEYLQDLAPALHPSDRCIYVQSRVGHDRTGGSEINGRKWKAYTPLNFSYHPPQPLSILFTFCNT